MIHSSLLRLRRRDNRSCELNEMLNSDFLPFFRLWMLMWCRGMRPSNSLILLSRA